MADAKRWVAIGAMISVDWGAGDGVYILAADHDHVVAKLRTDYEYAFNAGEVARSECDILRAEVERLRKDAELEGVIQRAASELPDGWEIRVSIERDAGVVELIDPHGTVVDFPSDCARLCDEVSEAIDAARESSR